MSILTVVQGVATKVGISPVPTSLFGGSDRTSIEMRETAQESARQIAEEFDWSVLNKIATITGDGMQTEWPVATTIPDFDRLIDSPKLYRAGDLSYSSLQYVQDFNTIVGAQADGQGMWGGYWAVYGGSIFIYDGSNNTALGDLQPVKLGYISRNIVRTVDGIVQPEFAADSDTFLLDERLLKLCIIWNWKKSHGQAYAAEMEEYQIALQMRRIADRNPQVIYGGRHPASWWRFE